MSEFIFSVSEIFDSDTRNGCLQQYGCSCFEIPSYQRGYKWGSEINQPVERLLSDLFKAWKDGAKEYLLQAITVRRVANDQKAGVLEVIDGQQRLTTLFILLHSLRFLIAGNGALTVATGKLVYSIRYEETSLDNLVTACFKADCKQATTFEGLLKAVDVHNEMFQDVYYLKCATLRCVYELNRQTKENNVNAVEKLESFERFLLSKTKLMVNAVEPHVQGEVIFGNLNSNRVLLTETELIKGLLLTKVAREPVANRTRRYREVLEMRIHLGRKWDEISRWANQLEVSSFYFQACKDGMSGLLELVALQMGESDKYTDKDSRDTNPLFEYFLGQRKWESVFSLLTNTHAALEDWYNTANDYNLLGYCLCHRPKNKARVQFLSELLGLPTKTEVKKRLFAERKNILWPLTQTQQENIEVKDLSYGESNEHIKFILLALSVFRDQEAESRFDFHAYHEEGWSLEHIFPQHPFGKGNNLTPSQEKVAFDVLIENEEEILTADTITEISKLKSDVNEATNRQKRGNEIIEKVPLLHQVGNLCLLRSDDNSAMGCGMFNDKRLIIRNRIADGSFVPRHTYEIFSKMIVGGGTSLEVWSKSDIEAHQEEISVRVNRLLKEEV